MILDDYQKRVDQLFEQVKTTQRENIITAGKMIADTIEAGGNIYLGGICHSIEMDLFNRGGGPAFYRTFHWNLDVKSDARQRDRSDMDLDMEGLGAYVLKASTIRPGDILFVGSVSGRTKSVVDLAWEAKKMGIKVIAMSSMSYAQSVGPVHSSGKKLYEFVDLTLDNCAPAAEAMLDVEGVEAKFAAASGLASSYILWSVTAVVLDELKSRGKTPLLLKSANYPGGPEYNKNEVYPHYEEFGW
ncbi:MAG: sugar isomerase domain-containing protein [Erysipelotrichaceae bacterium]|nr:sugar isomerase domain-containing protein [Erysipelotrichaceae bacterium]MBQ7888658.1 sugar isomerase domain-containing protein [Erysipelotrichaceae bacterium]